MKESIRHFPAEMQEALKRLTLIVRRKVKDTVMIIVVDPNDVEQRVRVRKGKPAAPKSTMSDLRIVIVSNMNLLERRQSLFDRIDKRFIQVTSEESHALSPVYFNISISRLNEGLKDGNLFCVTLRKYGIVLYDTNEYALSSPRQVDYEEVSRTSRIIMDRELLRADEFLWGAEQYFNHENHTLEAFLLYQAAECLMSTIIYIFLQYRFRQRHLEEWMFYCKRYTPAISEIFPCDSEEESRLFSLLARAHKEARFRPDFVLSSEEGEKLLLRVLILREFTEETCRKRIGCYRSMAEKCSV